MIKLNPASLSAYTIALICTIEDTYIAACHMLDERFLGPALPRTESSNGYGYVFGRISGHYVVIACLPPAQPGQVAAARVAEEILQTFPNLLYTLLVGTGGGAPSRKDDIRLGDVVVSQPYLANGGVVRVDLAQGGAGAGGKVVGHTNGPAIGLTNVTMVLAQRHDDVRKPDRMAEHIRRLDGVRGFEKPGVESDRLFQAEYRHVPFAGRGCGRCASTRMVKRPERTLRRVTNVHYGTIASTDTRVQDALVRDRFAQDPALRVLCFEMEAAGLMGVVPGLVIRGIENYCDSHQSDEWRGYAACTAAAYARELLLVMRPQQLS